MWILGVWREMRGSMNVLEKSGLCGFVMCFDLGKGKGLRFGGGIWMCICVYMHVCLYGISRG